MAKLLAALKWNSFQTTDIADLAEKILKPYELVWLKLNSDWLCLGIFGMRAAAAPFVFFVYSTCWAYVSWQGTALGEAKQYMEGWPWLQNTQWGLSDLNLWLSQQRWLFPRKKKKRKRKKDPFFKREDAGGRDRFNTLGEESWHLGLLVRDPGRVLLNSTF